MKVNGFSDKAISSLTNFFINDYPAFFEEYPLLAEEVFKKASAIKEKNNSKLNFKNVLASFKKGGLFGKGGILGLLTKNLFKKSQLVKDTPSIDDETSIATLASNDKKEENYNTNKTTGPITSTELASRSQVATEEGKQSFFDETTPLKVILDDISSNAEARINEIFPPLFEDIFKKIFKSEELKDLLGSIKTGTDETNYGEGIVPSILDFLSDAALLIGTRGRVKGGFSRRRTVARRAKNIQRIRQRRLSGTTTAKPPISAPTSATTKPLVQTTASPATKAVTTASKPTTVSPAVKNIAPAGKAATTSASKAATISAGKSSLSSFGKGAAKRIPLLGTAITVGMLGSEVYGATQAEKTGEITKEEAKKEKGGAVGSAVGGLAGAAGGAAVGAAIGSVVPIVGTVAGGVIGGILGGFGGDVLGRTAGEKIASTPETETNKNNQPASPPITPPPPQSVKQDNNFSPSPQKQLQIKNNESTTLKEKSIFSERTTLIDRFAREQGIQTPLSSKPIIPDTPKTPTQKRSDIAPVTPQPPVNIEQKEQPSIEIPKPIDNTDTLIKIAKNTGSTNDMLKLLSQAIGKLAQGLEGQKQGNNIIINGQQQGSYASASQLAATNVDPIRQVRMQFAV